MAVTDIVERLRDWPDLAALPGGPLMAEAADEIELLRQTIREWVPEVAMEEIERLREEQRHTHAHINHLRAEIERLRQEPMPPDDMK
jgi:hypothetical protein